MEQLSNFAKGLAEHFNNFLRGYPIDSVPNYTVFGRVEPTTMQVAGCDLE